MKIIEIMVWVLILSFVFSFGSTIFINSSENLNTFKFFLVQHTNKISQISKFEIDTWDCQEKTFTGLFLNQGLTWYFCSYKWTFNWYIKK